MTETPAVPHVVMAIIRCAGNQSAEFTLQHDGTPQAYIAVTVGRSVIYMHTRATAEHFGRIWEDARPAALSLPQRRTLVPPHPRPNRSDPSVVVHTAGRPAALVRLTTTAPRHLNVNIGDLAFQIYDQRAFLSVAEPFRRALESSVRLPATDLRYARTARAEARLSGPAAQHAAKVTTGEIQSAPQLSADDVVNAAVQAALRASAAMRPAQTSTPEARRVAQPSGIVRRVAGTRRLGLDNPRGTGHTR